ncbi:MAG: hypothetical protein IJY13_04765 [Clostridia bacterium]|nr:hypothetical protein [Clostridia bacterium]
MSVGVCEVDKDVGCLGEPCSCCVEHCGATSFDAGCCTVALLSAEGCKRLVKLCDCNVVFVSLQMPLSVGCAVGVLLHFSMAVTIFKSCKNLPKTRLACERLI